MNNFIQPNGTSLYGNFRTRTFSDIFESADNFQREWNESIFAQTLESLDMNLIFSLLYAYYGNSSIASSDENQFKYKLFSYIFQYAPTWSKELSTQRIIRSLNLSEFQRGSTNIVNSANNPSGDPPADSRQILPYINTQNVSTTQRSLVDGYAVLMSLLKDDITEKFIARFRNLFLTVVAPELPLWYENYPTED